MRLLAALVVLAPFVFATRNARTSPTCRKAARPVAPTVPPTSTGPRPFELAMFVKNLRDA